MSSLASHAVLIALVCGALAVIYGLALTRWVLSQPTGSDRMREISAAVQEGAAAYLKRQYTTIAGVAVVVFLLIGVAGIWTSDLGLEGRLRLPDRRGALGAHRLHRHERGGALEPAHGRGGQVRPRARALGRVQGRHGHRHPRRRARPARRRRLLRHPGQARQRHPGPPRPRDDEGARRPRLRRLARSRYSPASAAASSRRPPTSAPTWSARSRPASPRTTPATRR